MADPVGWLLWFAALAVWSGAAYGEELPAPRLLERERYSETYSLTAYGDGPVVQLQFAVTNLGWGSGRAICRLYVQHAGARIRKHEMYGRYDWQTAGEPVTSITAPGCSLHAAGPFRFRAAIDDVSVEVEAQVPLRPVDTPHTAVESKDGRYGSQILLSASPAVIHWSIGGKIKSFTGYAHVDHSLSTLLPGAIASGWLRFRALAGDEPVLFSLRMAPRVKEFEGWQIAGGVLGDMTAARPSWWPHDTPGARIELPGGAMVLGPQIERFEPLRDLGILRRAAEVLVGRSQTTLYWAEWQGRRGILEVSIQD